MSESKLNSISAKANVAKELVSERVDFENILARARKIHFVACNSLDQFWIRFQIVHLFGENQFSLFRLIELRTQCGDLVLNLPHRDKSVRAENIMHREPDDYDRKNQS